MHEFSDKSYSNTGDEFSEPEWLIEIQITPDESDTSSIIEALPTDTSEIGIPDDRGMFDAEPVSNETAAISDMALPEDANVASSRDYPKFRVDLAKLLQGLQEESGTLEASQDVEISVLPEPEITDVSGNSPDMPELPTPLPQIQGSEDELPAPSESDLTSAELPKIRLAGESDVADRLPQFEKLKEAVTELAEQGALEGVSEGVRYYLDRMVPVGVNEKGEVVRPEGYRPEDMVPVLVVKPGESVETYTLPGLVGEAEAAERVIESTGTLVSMRAELLDGSVSSVLSANKSAQTRYSELMVAPNNSPEQPYPVYLPRLIVMSEWVPDYPGADSAQIVVHEIDHWNFFVGKGPTLRSENGERYSGAQLQAIAEKSAYETQCTVGQNLGHYDFITSAEELAEPFKAADISPEYPDSMAAMPRSLERHLMASGVPERSVMPFIVKAIAYTYGHPDKRITDEEVIAFRNIGILAKGI